MRSAVKDAALAATARKVRDDGNLSSNRPLRATMPTCEVTYFMVPDCRRPGQAHGFLSSDDWLEA
jgi:hypothetical protein